MLRGVRRSIDRWTFLWLALALGGCAIADSTVVDLRIPYAPGTVACSSTLGSYSLPKSFIHVVVGRPTGPKLAAPDFVVNGDALPDKFNFEVVRRPDPALTLCLDYLASIFASDEVSVIKQDVDKGDNGKPDPGTSPGISRQFLQMVLFNATDRTVQIARNLIQATFIGLSGNPDFGPARAITLQNTNPEILADLEFDPFDTRDSAEANARLAPLGICLVLEGFTFDRRTLSVDQYCNAPVRAREHPPRIAELYAVKSREPIPPNTPGILYRPRQTYMISVYRRDVRGRGSWNLTNRMETQLENLSPVIAMGITRAIFARRNTIIKFDQGTLTTVCVAKTSEIENFVAIPFEVARSLVALPAQIVQVRINRIAQQQELARVQDLFIQTQARLLKAQATQMAQGAVPGSSPIRPTQINTDPLGQSKLKSLEPDANTFTITDKNLVTQQWIQDKCGSEIIAAPPDDLPLFPSPTAQQ